MAKKQSPTEVPGMKGVDVGDIASNLDIPEYSDDAYRDRQSARPARDYVVEDDPILAEGDARVPHVAQVQDNPPINPVQAAPGVVLAESSDDPLTRLARAIENMSARPAASMDTSLMERLVAVMEKVVQGQVAGNAAATQAMLKGKDPSNMHAPGISAFNPRGELKYPRPKLKCRVFLPWEAEVESLTREEIELINLLEPGEYVIKRSDESRVGITVAGSRNVNNPDTFDRLLMNSETGFNNDYAYLMPPLRSILRQILNQRPHTKAAAKGIMTTDEEIDLIEQHGVDFDEAVAAEKR